MRLNTATRVQFVNKTKLSHLCRFCAGTIKRGKKAVVLLHEGVNIEGDFYQHMQYFCNIIHLRKWQGGFNGDGNNEEQEAQKRQEGLSGMCK